MHNFVLELRKKHQREHAPQPPPPAGLGSPRLFSASAYGPAEASFVGHGGHPGDCMLDENILAVLSLKCIPKGLAFEANKASALLVAL